MAAAMLGAVSLLLRRGLLVLLYLIGACRIVRVLGLSLARVVVFTLVVAAL